MRPDAQIGRLEVRPSMKTFRFDPVPHPRTPPPRNDDRRRLNCELQTKVAELEKFYAAHKIMLSEGNLGGDLLRQMADDSETNVKMGSSEIRRGRAYDRYVQKRDVKKSEAWESRRREMEMMENKFKERSAQMKARRGRDDAAVKYRRQVGTNSIQMSEEEDAEEQMQMLHRQEKSSNRALPSDLSVKSIADRRLLSAGKNSPSTKIQSSASTAYIPKPYLKHTNSDSTSGRARAIRSSAQSVPNFSYLRKENMKPPTRGNTPLQSTARSKSSTNLSELKDLSSRNSNHYSDFPSPKLPKQQGQKTINRKIESKANTVPRKDNGGSLAELRVSKAFEIQDKQVDSEKTIDQLIYSAELIKTELIEARPAIFHIEPACEEPRSSEEAGTCDTKSEKFEILKCANEADNGLATVSKLNTSSNNENKSGKESVQLCSSNIIQTSQSCVHVASSHTQSSVPTPTGSPATWTTFPQNMMQEGDSTRVRRRWEISEKPKIASKNSDKLLKEVTQQFKKLLKFGRKGKHADNSVHNLASSPSASGGDGDTEDGHEVSKLSLDDMNKSTSEHFSPYYVGLNEGKFPPRQVQSPSYSTSTSPANIKFRKDHQQDGFSKATCSVFSMLPVIPWKGK